jgi:hypothetical protein
VRYEVPTSAVGLSPLRHAVLWQQGGGAPLVLSDEPIAGMSFEVSFALPERVSLPALLPVEALVLGVAERHQGEATWLEEVTAEVYRPRVVVYADTNRNGVLDVSLEQAFLLGDESEQSARDSIVAIDPPSGPSVAAFLDPWSALRKLDLDSARAYYDREGELRRFTVTQGYGVLSPTPVRQIWLDPTTSDEAVANLACGRNVYQRSAQTSLSVVLDAPLDRAALCGLAVQDCQSRRLSQLDAPTLETSAARVVQCKHSTELDSLVVVERSTLCQGCTCTHEYTTTAWIALAEQTPRWWPCGESVPYCATDDSPLYGLSYECGSEPPAFQSGPDAGSDSGSDAGASRPADPDADELDSGATDG